MLRTTISTILVLCVLMVPLTPVHAETNTQLITLYTRLIALLEARLLALQGHTVSQVAATHTPTTGHTLVVSDPGQPSPSLAPADAGVLFLAFDLTAGDTDVTVSRVTIKKSGLGDDRAFYDFGLYDDQGLQVGPTVALDSTHQLVIRRSFVIPAHTTRTFELYANMQSDLSAYEAQMPSFTLTGIEANAPVSGTLPLVGNPHTINTTITVGGAHATLSPYDPMNDTQRVIFENNVRFSGIRLTADAHEDLSLSQILWTQSGTVSPSDVSNVRTIAGDASYPTFISPYDSRTYVTNFEPAITIPKGQTIDLFVQGDILPSAANRTIAFDIHDNSDDISLTGLSYGFGVGAIPGGNTAIEGHSVFITDTGDTDGESLVPFFAGSVATVYSAIVNSIGR